ncbi:hypothetical protein LTR08_002736 [Meristemomyces frigidus]|nr:hypothetical protein LTR08_002736 [Meristemomyces frigidus]
MDTNVETNMTPVSAGESVQKPTHSLMDTTFPVLVPFMPELLLPKDEFEAYIKQCPPSVTPAPVQITLPTREAPSQASANVDDVTSTIPFHALTGDDAAEDDEAERSPFMDGLLADGKTVPSLDEHDGKMLTENGDVAYRTSGEALVDLFAELEDVMAAGRLRALLEKAWEADSDATLKIIWNARSIHLGKSSRNTFYRAIGWLAETHPATLLTNLPWLVRPVIQKKMPKEKKGDGETNCEPADVIQAEEADSDFEIIDERELDGQLEEDVALSFDVNHGVAHGYWKDLLNILVLAVNDELTADGDPRSILNVERPPTKKNKSQDWTKGRKKTQTADRHERAVKKLEDDPFYKALHISVARLFAEQLALDLARLESGSMSEIKRITLAGKWAPSHKGMHDQHTCIVSSIAELMQPVETRGEQTAPAARTPLLKQARLDYQMKILSPLRKVLEIVERPIAAGAFDEIKYERVPSLAMKQYTPLFAKKDFARFDGYIDKVASGKAQISGATLLPSTLVRAVSGRATSAAGKGKARGVNALVEQKLQKLQARTLDAQWNTLVQRIKDSGTLESSIAVCDVSGSMAYVTLADGTTPMDSSIGLSLLLAEVTKPPFGGAFITFSEDPQVMHVGGPDDKRSFEEKVDYIQRSDWGMNTDFVAVFERLILPMAVAGQIKQDDMVKQVFVFSDMQFDSARETRATAFMDGQEVRGGDWYSSYERIKKSFEDQKYTMPRLIFWDLAGGSSAPSRGRGRGGIAMARGRGQGRGRGGRGYNAGAESDSGGDEVAPKPVMAAEQGTALVSGYSQGQLKMFLDNGQFEDAEDEVVAEDAEGSGDEVVVGRKKAKMDPLAMVRKAISHEAYRMLVVVD